MDAVFDHPRKYSVAYWLALAYSVLMTAGMMWWGLSEEANLGPLLLGLFFPVLWACLASIVLHQIARAIRVSPREIRSKSFTGRNVSLRWTDLVAVQEFSSLTLGGHVRFLRLIGRSGKRILISSRTNDYDELLGRVRRLAPDRDETYPFSLVDRLLGAKRASQDSLTPQ
jgi:hypothetical protein